MRKIRKTIIDAALSDESILYTCSSCALLGTVGNSESRDHSGSPPANLQDPLIFRPRAPVRSSILTVDPQFSIWPRSGIARLFSRRHAIIRGLQGSRSRSRIIYLYDNILYVYSVHTSVERRVVNVKMLYASIFLR